LNVIALEWNGDEDTTFEPDERFLFYAEPRFSRWTTTDVYFLTVDGTPGLRMPNRSATSTGLPTGNLWMDQTMETNALYTPNCYCASLPLGRDGDRWTWDVLRRPDRASMTYRVNLPTLNVTQPATLTTWFISYTEVGAAPDHRVNEKLNDVSLGQAEWDGKQAITATLTISANVLLNGDNALNLALPGLTGVTSEGMWLDAFSIRYARGSAASGNAVNFTGEAAPHAYTLSLSSTTGLRAYDVTNPLQPERLTANTVSLSGNSAYMRDWIPNCTGNCARGWEDIGPPRRRKTPTSASCAAIRSSVGAEPSTRLMASASSARKP